MNARLLPLILLTIVTGQLVYASEAGLAPLHGMEQEPPRKSPKMALSFLLNQSAGPACAARTKRLFRCPMCGVITTRRLALEQHVIKVHGVWSCPEHGCVYKTPHLRGLVGHLRSRHYHEKPKSCPQCSQSAFIREYLSHNLCKKHLS